MQNSSVFSKSSKCHYFSILLLWFYIGAASAFLWKLYSADDASGFLRQHDSRETVTPKNDPPNHFINGTDTLGNKESGGMEWEELTGTLQLMHTVLSRATLLMLFLSAVSILSIVMSIVGKCGGCYKMNCVCASSHWMLVLLAFMLQTGILTAHLIQSKLSSLLENHDASVAEQSNGNPPLFYLLFIASLELAIVVILYLDGCCTAAQQRHLLVQLRTTKKTWSAGQKKSTEHGGDGDEEPRKIGSYSTERRRQKRRTLLADFIYDDGATIDGNGMNKAYTQYAEKADKKSIKPNKISENYIFTPIPTAPTATISSSEFPLTTTTNCKPKEEKPIQKLGFRKFLRRNKNKKKE
jgi:hypothetical protein